MLARYAGLAEAPPRISGYVQHGWNIGDGFAAGTRTRPATPSSLVRAARAAGWAAGRRNYVVIGAPWAYLLALRAPAGRSAAEQREGTIWYPFHGWEGQHVGQPPRLIAQIQDTEPGPVTVCLYWNEYRIPEVRRLYERAGFRVICHGYRGHWWKDTDPDFLDRAARRAAPAPPGRRPTG